MSFPTWKGLDERGQMLKEMENILGKDWCPAIHCGGTGQPTREYTVETAPIRELVIAFHMATIARMIKQPERFSQALGGPVQ